MTAGVDRRKFLLHSGAGVGGLLASPRLAIAGALAAGLGLTKDSPDEAAAIVEAQHKVFFHANEPMNTAGHPFGFQIATLNLIALPEVTKATGKHRYSLVVGHLHPRKNCDEKFAQRSVGITTLEVTRDESGHWAHDISAIGNRRFDALTALPIDGARLNTGDEPMLRHQKLDSGASGITSSHTTAWQSVLCGESAGWLIEVQPRVGSIVKRFSMGRIYPVAITSFAETGAQASVYVLSQAPGTNGFRIFKFVSHQRFDARRGDANSSLLVIGDLLVADAEKKTWTNLTHGLTSFEWENQMPVICERADLPAPQTDFSQTAFEELARRLMPVMPATLNLRVEVQGAAFEVEALEDGASRLWLNARIIVSK
jgi:hypothetical protein